jgi:hypothetical protein
MKKNQNELEVHLAIFKALKDEILPTVEIPMSMTIKQLDEQVDTIHKDLKLPLILAATEILQKFKSNREETRRMHDETLKAFFRSNSM